MFLFLLLSHFIFLAASCPSGVVNPLLCSVHVKVMCIVHGRMPSYCKKWSHSSMTSSSSLSWFILHHMHTKNLMECMRQCWIFCRRVEWLIKKDVPMPITTAYNIIMHVRNKKLHVIYWGVGGCEWWVRIHIFFMTWLSLSKKNT